MKRWIHASEERNWPAPEDWEYVETDEDMEEMWDKYLCRPEEAVSKELQIFLEPSVQGGMGEMFIYDESGEDRFESFDVDFQDWNEREIQMAVDSKDEVEYKAKFKSYVENLIKEAME